MSLTACRRGPATLACALLRAGALRAPARRRPSRHKRGLSMVGLRRQHGFRRDGELDTSASAVACSRPRALTQTPTARLNGCQRALSAAGVRACCRSEIGSGRREAPGVKAARI